MRAIMYQRGKILKITGSAALSLVLFFGIMDATSASTNVSGVISSDTVWTLTGSPYVVSSDLFIDQGVTLSIDPGVVVKFQYSNIDVAGTLDVNGTSSEKVYFTSFVDDSVAGDTNGDGSATSPAPGDWNGISSFERPDSNILLDNAVVRYASQGLYLREADVALANSIFENNYVGIREEGKSVVNISNSQVVNNDTGILILQLDYEPNPIFNVDTLSIHGNQYGGVSYYITPPLGKGNDNHSFFAWFSNLFKAQDAKAQSTYVVDFRNTWWGDASGPTHPDNPAGLGDLIDEDTFLGSDVLYDPWLIEDPFEQTCVANCYSNVLFLPGLKGSVLNRGSDTLWPPTILSNDIPQLALDGQGESVNDIHVAGILDKFYSADVYLPFSNFMDDLEDNQDLIEEWFPMAYDWRFSVGKILGDGVKMENEVVDVIAKVEELANNSRTGKVTIVAHSMGGLLGKAIIKELEAQGKDSLIDSFLMVGTPQLGTPQAISSILHGDSEGIVAGFIVDASDIRAIAQNIPSAYDLLPSRQYFNDVSDPVIVFDEDASFTQTWRLAWGSFINTYTSFSEFVTDSIGLRAKPPAGLLRVPEILRSDLMSDADDLHAELDSYQFPDQIRVVQVAGWGIPTVKGVEYKNQHNIQSYETLFTNEGDKTVVYPSAVSSNTDETYYFNLSLFNKNSSQNAQHKDLLSNIPIHDVLLGIIKDIPISTTSYISTTKPPLTEVDTQLMVSTHSPVVLSVYDENGNFTGIVPNQNLSQDILETKEEIPGSIFLYTNESQYIFLPNQGNYDFVYKGTGSGPVTVKIEEFKDDVVTPVVQYTDLPTTLDTEANFTLETASPGNTQIVLDTNGDGITDETVFPDGQQPTPTLSELLALVKEKISSLDVKDKMKQKLLKKVAVVEKKISKEKKTEKVLKALDNLSKNIDKKSTKGKISDADAQVLLDLLEQIESMI